MQYTVTNAMKTGGYDSKYGPRVKYTIQFEGVEDAVELSQKPDTPAPKAGDTLEGTIEDTQYGKKFKKAETASSSKSYGKSPEEQTSIQRQVALKAAVEVLRDFTTESNGELKDYVNKVINVAVAFERHLETGAPVGVKPDLGAEFDAALAVDSGEDLFA